MTTIMPVGDGSKWVMVQRSVWALTHLPPDDGSRYGVRALTAAWLYEQKDRTMRGYFRELSLWLSWCHQNNIDPVAARPTDVGRYRVDLEAIMAAASASHAMSGASSWYRYLVANDAAAANPFAGARRPKYERDESTTVGLSFDEVLAILDVADAERGRTGPRTRALVRLLSGTGVRVGEAISLDAKDVGNQRGHRTITYVAKGNKRRTRPLDPSVAHYLDLNLADRLARGLPYDGPLLAAERRGVLTRIDEPYVFRLLRKLARTAGIVVADRISPHSLRHFFATDAFERGLHLADIQDSLGHADPRTTRLYDRGRHRLERDASLTVGAALAARRAFLPPPAATVADR
jgi:integrase/recombinase XerD